ncbi:MAG: signal recognition particle-docking protein FtsY [Chloroflexi bacterium]|nr:signal recognition particle-docking protein FtsY [Chloroflexota bacterium]
MSDKDQKEQTEKGVQRTRQAWWGRLARVFRGGGAIEPGLWEELEAALLMADVGVATTERLIGRVREQAQRQGFRQPEEVRQALQREMVQGLRVDGARPGAPASSPEVILVVGVNGVGKTTSIAKLGRYYQRQGKRVVLAAADTFRAAAIEQLQTWGERLGAPVIAHKQGADPGAVAFDAMQAAQARGAQMLIVDTAGRLHTKFNLMEELKKVHRVISRCDSQAPHQVLLVLDATTGQNGLTQARAFTQAIGVSGLFLAKLDATAKGGIVLAVSQELRIPVLYLGTGERLDDMVPFDAEAFVQALLAPEA